jgi:hypothetical protein
MSNLNRTNDERFTNSKNEGDNWAMGNQADPSMNKWLYRDGGVRSANPNIPDAAYTLGGGIGEWDKQNVKQTVSGVFGQ